MSEPVMSEPVVDDSLVYRTPRCLFLAPHNDDETLFGAYTLFEHRPRVIVVLRSAVQELYGIRHEEREAETAAACYVLGCPYEQWPYVDTAPDWDKIEERISRLSDTYDRCFAPAVEEDGHEHHSAVGRIAARYFSNLTPYLTYRRGSGKSEGVEVVPFDPSWIQAKLRALACYESQMRPETGCQSWFTGDLREWRPA